jgi:hypothetical protein
MQIPRRIAPDGEVRETRRAVRGDAGRLLRFSTTRLHQARRRGDAHDKAALRDVK